MARLLDVRTATAGLCASLLVLTLAGCGDDPDGDQPGGGSASASATASESSEAPSASESGSESASESATPSESAAPAVTPASGPALTVKGLALNLPAGWEISFPGSRNEAGYDPGDSGGTIVVTALLAGTGEDLESDAESALDNAKSLGFDAQRLDNREVGGVECWVVTGTRKAEPLQVQVGTLTNGRTFLLSFRWVREPPADAQAIIDSVLATVTYPPA